MEGLSLFKFLFNWEKDIHIIRGLPGSGKSTLALKLVNDNRNQVVENDDFWLFGGISYQYEPQMTHIAGHWAWSETFRRLRVYNRIAVANTFIKREFVFSYVNEAVKLGINIHLHQPETAWKDNIDECFTKNVHGVPKEIIQKMKNNWETIEQSEIDDIITIAKTK